VGTEIDSKNGSQIIALPSVLGEDCRVLSSRNCIGVIVFVFFFVYYFNYYPDPNAGNVYWWSRNKRFSLL
jgi:hypothetical protein